MEGVPQAAEVEGALLTAESATVSPVDRRKAQTFLSDCKSHPETWKVCIQLFNEEHRTQSIITRFWPLQVITERLPTLSPTERDVIKQSIIVPYWARTLPNQISRCLTSESSQNFESSAILGRLSLLHVQLLRLDYPHHWPDAFTFPIRAVVDRSNSSDDLDRRVAVLMAVALVKLQQMFDAEVVAEEAPRSADERNLAMAIKDAMRLHDVTVLVSFWSSILSSRFAAPIVSGGETDYRLLICATLTVTGKYIDWMDLPLVVSDKYLLSSIFQYVRDGSDVANKGPRLAAISCLCCLFKKRMTGAQRVLVLRELGALELLLECVPQANGPPNSWTSDSEWMESLGDAVNLAGLQLLLTFTDLGSMARPDAPEPSPKAAPYVLHVDPNKASCLQGEAWNRLEQILPHALLFLGHSVPRVALTTIPFLSDFFRQVKRSCDSRHPLVRLEVLQNLLQTTLVLCVGQIQLPSWFEMPEHEDELYDDILGTRFDFLNLFKRVFAVDPKGVGVKFVTSVVTEMCNSLNSGASIPWQQIESILKVLSASSEQFREPNDAESFYAPSADAILSCKALATHARSEIISCIFDILIKFNTYFFSQASPHIPGIIRLLLSGILTSPSSRVVKEATSCLLRLVRSNVTLAAKHIDMILPPLLAAGVFKINIISSSTFATCSLNNCPTPALPSRPQISTHIQNDLFESLGCLLGASNLQQGHSLLKQFVESLLEPLQDKHRATLMSMDDQSAAALCVSRIIQNVSAVSKGFKSRQAAVDHIWLQCCERASAALDWFPHDFDVRSAIMFLCRRMVLVLGEGVCFPPLATLIPKLYQSALASRGSPACQTPRLEGPGPQTLVAEIGHLSGLCAFVLCTFKAGSAQLMRSCPVIQNVPLIVWCMEQHIQFLRSLPEDNPESKREKVECETSLYQMISTLCIHDPVSALELIIGQESESVPYLRIVDLLIAGCSPDRFANATQYLITCQSWAKLVECLVSSEPNFVKYQGLLPMKVVWQNVFNCWGSLDFRDPQHAKVVTEICSMLHLLFSASSITAKPEFGLEIKSHVRQAFLDCFAVHVANNPKQAEAAFEEICSSKSQKQSRDATRAWVEMMHRSSVR